MASNPSLAAVVLLVVQLMLINIALAENFECPVEVCISAGPVEPPPSIYDPLTHPMNGPGPGWIEPPNNGNNVIPSWDEQLYQFGLNEFKTGNICDASHNY